MVCRLELAEQDLRGQELSEPVVLHAAGGFRDWAGRRLVTLDVKADHDGRTDGDVEVRIDRLVHVKVRVEPRITGAVAAAATAQPAEVRPSVAETGTPETARGPAFRRGSAGSQFHAREPAGGTRGRRSTAASAAPAASTPLSTRRSSRSRPGWNRRSSPSRWGGSRSSSPPRPKSSAGTALSSSGRPSGTVELEVQGPAPDIERLQPQDIRVQLVLTADNKPNPAAPMPGKLDVVGLPPGVKLVKPLPTVNFFLEEQNKPAPAAP